MIQMIQMMKAFKNTKTQKNQKYKNTKKLKKQKNKIFYYLKHYVEWFYDYEHYIIIYTNQSKRND